MVFILIISDIRSATFNSDSLLLKALKKQSARVIIEHLHKYSCLFSFYFLVSNNG